MYDTSHTFNGMNIDSNLLLAELKSINKKLNELIEDRPPKLVHINVLSDEVGVPPKALRERLRYRNIPITSGLVERELFVKKFS